LITATGSGTYRTRWVVTSPISKITVLDLGVGNVKQPNGLIGNGSTLFQNYPMNLYYGYVSDGLFVNQDDINTWPTQTAIAPNPKPGDIRYKDINGPEGKPRRKG